MSDILHPDAVRAMRARADAATAGPWFRSANWHVVCKAGWSVYDRKSGADNDHYIIAHVHGPGGNNNKASDDFDFIAAARTDLPALCDSWLALHAEVERLAGWKAEHLIVHADFQAIGKLIGVGLGQFVHDKIEPFLRAIIAERDALRRRLEAAENGLDRAIGM